MGVFTSMIAKHQHLSEEAQKRAGKAAGNDMDDAHKRFLAELIGMLDRKDIVTTEPPSLLKRENYQKLSEQDRGAVDLALMNLIDQVRHIEEFYHSKATPNASPELQTMIEYLWDMKTRLEDRHGDVLKL